VCDAGKEGGTTMRLMAKLRRSCTSNIKGAHRGWTGAHTCRERSVRTPQGVPTTATYISMVTTYTCSRCRSHEGGLSPCAELMVTSSSRSKPSGSPNPAFLSRGFEVTGGCLRVQPDGGLQMIPTIRQGVGLR
jgi:hypothetical protein